MRRRCVMLAILGLVAVAPTIGSSEADTTNMMVTATVAVPTVPRQAPWLRDEAAMMLVGSALVGLAAAIRRAT
jgi:hypothetical protein